MELPTPSATSEIMVKVAGQLIAAAPTAMLAIVPAHGLLAPRVTLSGSASVTSVSATGPIFVRVMVRGMVPDCTDVRVLFVTATRSAATFIVATVVVLDVAVGDASVPVRAPAHSVTALAVISSDVRGSETMHTRVAPCARAVFVATVAVPALQDTTVANAVYRSASVLAKNALTADRLGPVFAMLTAHCTLPAQAAANSRKCHVSTMQGLIPTLTCSSLACTDLQPWKSSQRSSRWPQSLW